MAWSAAGGQTTRQSSHGRPGQPASPLFPTHLEKLQRRMGAVVQQVQLLELGQLKWLWEGEQDAGRVGAGLQRSTSLQAWPAIRRGRSIRAAAHTLMTSRKLSSSSTDLAQGVCSRRCWYAYKVVWEGGARHAGLPLSGAGLQALQITRPLHLLCVRALLLTLISEGRALLMTACLSAWRSLRTSSTSTLLSRPPSLSTLRGGGRILFRQCRELRAACSTHCRHAAPTHIFMQVRRASQFESEE